MPKPGSALLHAIAVLVVTLTLLPALEGTANASVSLEQMMRNCEQLESFWRMKPPKGVDVLVPNQIGAAVCFGYLLAFCGLEGLVEGTDYRRSSNEEPTPFANSATCSRTLNICAPKYVSANQILKVFLTYARNHAAQGHEDAWFHYLEAMQVAFPCKGT